MIVKRGEIKRPMSNAPAPQNADQDTRLAAPDGTPLEFEFPDGTRKTVLAGSTVREALNGYPSPHPVVAAYLNYKITTLDRKLTYSGRVEPVHLATRDGALIYRRSISFLLIRAMEELYPEFRVIVNHSLSGGYYVEMHPNSFKTVETVVLTKTDLERIRTRMQQIIDADEPFVRNEMPVKDAIALFEKKSMHQKVQLLKDTGSDTVAVYSCGGAINHFYGLLVPSTGFLKQFDLHLESPGIVLMFPPVEKPEVLPPYVRQPKLFQVYQEYERSMSILGLDTVAELNALVRSGKIREYILIAEALHEKKLAQIADRIKESPTHPRVVTIAGPSASGKTTFVKRLSIQLRINGFRPLCISMDDFFVNREQTPRDETGDYNFEDFEAIDYRYFGEVVTGLLQGKEVMMPKFDFASGSRTKGHMLRIDPDQIILIEGIHGLNDRLLSSLPDGLKFRIYVSPLTHLNIDEHNRISSSDVRLLRRMVRDSKYRSYKGADTLKRWHSVRRGEEVNIFPYQERADMVFNSSLPHEINILAPFAMKVLNEVERKGQEFAEAARLLRFLSYFKEIPADEVPGHSLLREFIGGSRFKY